MSTVRSGFIKGPSPLVRKLGSSQTFANRRHPAQLANCFASVEPRPREAALDGRRRGFARPWTGCCVAARGAAEARTSCCVAVHGAAARGRGRAPPWWRMGCADVRRRPSFCSLSGATPPPSNPPVRDEQEGALEDGVCTNSHRAGQGGDLDMARGGRTATAKSMGKKRVVQAGMRRCCQ